MPLLHKKAFVRKKPPVQVNPKDKVFYCELTNEAFVDYDEYWERLVLCNAMVWTCELTGRPNLTYQEALDCEARGLKYTSTIVPAIKKPLLYLTTLTRRGRHVDVNEDVFTYMRDRYFVGECVEAIVSNHWYDCKVTRILYPTAEEIAVYELEMASSDEEEENDKFDDSLKSNQEAMDPLNLQQEGSFSKPITLDDSDSEEEVKIINEAPAGTPKKGKSPIKSQIKSETKSPTKSPSKKGTKTPQFGDNYPPYATFKYEVEEDLAWDYKTCKRHIVGWEQIRRIKNVLTREKCKLFLKICTELTSQGFWAVKPSVARKYNLASVTFNEIFPGEPPRFRRTPAKKLFGGPNQSPQQQQQQLSPNSKLTEQRRKKKEEREMKIREKKEVREEKKSTNKAEAAESGVVKKKGKRPLTQQGKFFKKTERTKQKLNANGTAQPRAIAPAPQTAQQRAESELQLQKQLEQRQRHQAELRELHKAQLEKEKAGRKMERDVRNYQRSLLAVEMREWLRPKEDLCCAGLLALPKSVPVQCGIPNHLFGDFLSLLEFLNSFCILLELNDVYPHGISFEMLESAMVTKEVAGVFNDVVQLLLGAVFSLQEEEDEEITADTTIDSALGLGLDPAKNSGDQRLAAVLLSNRASQWSSQQHNTSLHQLPLDALTLTEVLRLHLLASGADTNVNSQWRHANRGGYKHWDDPGLQFKMDSPDIVQQLSIKSIFDMHISDKICMLQVLMEQILTYAGVRDRLEEAFEKIRELKATLREQQHAFNKIEREENAARQLKVREQRQKKLDQMIKGGQKKGGAGLAGAKPAAVLPEAAGEKQPVVQETEEERKEREEKEEKSREKRTQEHRKKELDLLEQIMNSTAKVNPMSLGQDRAYRRYWVFNSIPGLFIEDDELNPGICYDIASNEVVDIPPNMCPITIARLKREALMMFNPGAVKDADVKEVEEKANTSDKENDTSLIGGTPGNNGAFVSMSGGSSGGMVCTITTAPTTPVRPLLSSPVMKNNSSAKKLLKLSNGVVKEQSSKRGKKNQDISKFFMKPNKLENSNTSEQVSPTKGKSPSNRRNKDIKQEQEFTVKSPLKENSEITLQAKTKNENVSDLKKENMEEKIEDEQNIKEVVKPSDTCTASSSCPVHAAKTDRLHWSFYYKEEDITALINSLNSRGEREAALKDNLILYRMMLDNNVKQCPVYILNPTEDCEQDTAIRKSRRTGGKKGGDYNTNLNFPIGTPIEYILEMTLRDMILEVEEKLYVGALVRVMVENRDQWREMIANDKELLQIKDAHTMDWAGRNRIASFKAELSIEDDCGVTGAEAAAARTVVQALAITLLQVAQSIEPKYMKEPLAESDKAKQKRQKAERKLRRFAEKREKERGEQENNNNSDDSDDSDIEAGDMKNNHSVSNHALRTPLERWETSLMTSVSYSQVFLHMATLDNSVTWSRSLTKTRCRVCRKGGDHEKMLLCDGCDKGHHIYCLKPELKSIPEGDWFCDQCKPKLKTKSPKKNRTIYVEEDEEVEEEDQEEEQDAEEEQEESVEGFEDDYCEVCNVGGDLVCCNGCPRSFHPKCVALKKIPRGAWLCPQCSTKQKKKEEKEAAAYAIPEKEKKKTTYKSSKKLLEDKGKRSSAIDSNIGVNKIKKRKSTGDVVLQSQRKRNSPDYCELTPDGPSLKKRKTQAAMNGEVKDHSFRIGNSRRAALMEDANDGGTLHTSVLHSLLIEMINHEDGWPFQKPVNKKLVPDYYVVIKKPMDFHTMRQRLNSVAYKNDSEFVADALLVFQNCQQYNMENTHEYLAGARLANIFRTRAKQMGLKVDMNTDGEDAVEETGKRTKAAFRRNAVPNRKRTSL